MSVKGFAAASAILWGAAVGIVGVCNMIWPGYGGGFLGVISSVYPGYAAAPGLGSVLVGTGYAVVDGGIGGAIFAWLYNRCAK